MGDRRPIVRTQQMSFLCLSVAFHRLSVAFYCLSVPKNGDFLSSPQQLFLSLPATAPLPLRCLPSSCLLLSPPVSSSLFLVMSAQQLLLSLPFAGFPRCRFPAFSAFRRRAKLEAVAATCGAAAPVRHYLNRVLLLHSRPRHCLSSRSSSPEDTALALCFRCFRS